jgi:hypothetical protein
MMEHPPFTTVEVFQLRRKGRPVAFALSVGAIRSQIPTCGTGYEVVSEWQVVGTVEGRVFDWSKRGGHSFTPKIHWNCPQCGQEWWEDFTENTENPHFAASGCACVEWWLVHWDRSQAARELTTQ